MKIVSIINKDTTVNFSNTEVEFNKKGIAEVKKEIGEQIIKDFPKTVWEEGKEPKVEVKPQENVELDNGQTQILKDEIVRLKGVILDKTKEVEKAKKQEQTWRGEFEKLQKEMDGKGKNITPIIEPKKEVKEEVKENKEDVTVEFEIPEGKEDLHDGMKGKNYTQLKKWVKDQWNKTDDDLSEIEKLDSKDKRDGLIKFVFENCEIE
jgi:hypothetical protein